MHIKWLNYLIVVTKTTLTCNWRTDITVIRKTIRIDINVKHQLNAMLVNVSLNKPMLLNEFKMFLIKLEVRKSRYFDTILIDNVDLILSVDDNCRIIIDQIIAIIIMTCTHLCIITTTRIWPLSKWLSFGLVKDNIIYFKFNPLTKLTCSVLFYFSMSSHCIVLPGLLYIYSL